MHRENRDQHCEGKRCGRRSHEQADDERQPAEEFGRAGEQCHQIAGVQPDRAEELAGAFEAVATEPAEQLLRAMCGEDQAHGDAQGQRAEARLGGQDAVDELLVHVGAP